MSVLMFASDRWPRVQVETAGRKPITEGGEQPFQTAEAPAGGVGMAWGLTSLVPHPVPGRSLL